MNPLQLYLNTKPNYYCSSYRVVGYYIALFFNATKPLPSGPSHSRARSPSEMTRMPTTSALGTVSIGSGSIRLTIAHLEVQRFSIAGRSYGVPTDSY